MAVLCFYYFHLAAAVEHVYGMGKLTTEKKAEIKSHAACESASFLVILNSVFVF